MGPVSCQVICQAAMGGLRARYTPNNRFAASRNATAGAPASAAYNLPMRIVFSLLSLAVVLLISWGIYYAYLKHAAPTAGSTAVQAISTTGVEMDLLSIAQAERMYNAQNGSYAGLEQLASTGTMNVNSSGRDGYAYTVNVTPEGFTVTAQHPDVPVPSSATPLHYPTVSVDQTMQVRTAN
jgi:hypothetical protein